MKQHKMAGKKHWAENCARGGGWGGGRGHNYHYLLAGVFQGAVGIFFVALDYQIETILTILGTSFRPHISNYKKKRQISFNA